MLAGRTIALLDPDMSVLIQRHHSYTRVLNSETSGDSKNTVLHCGDVSDRVSESHSKTIPIPSVASSKPEKPLVLAGPP